MKTAQNSVTNLGFGGCDTVELVERYGTPLYVVSEEIIQNKCKEIREDFLSKYNNTRAVYASKAFLTMAMCKIMEREGLGLDVVSGGELYTAIKAGFPLEQVIFHGNNKSMEELTLAVSSGVGRIVVDNLYELELLKAIGIEQKKTISILFRVSPGVGGKTHQYISTGQKDSKFGIPLVDNIIEQAVGIAMESEYIDLKGFHFHIGSQLFDNESYLEAIDILVKRIHSLKEKLGFVTAELNTGGGFGIRYLEEDRPKPLSYFVDAIMEAVVSKCKEASLEIPTIIIEPGRWIIGEAGITLYKIGAVKEIPGVRTYASVDGGLPDNPRPALYGAKYRAVLANKMDQERTEVVTIAGKCCESGDILIWDLEIPPVVPGDVLAILSTGAYNYSMASNYNRLPRPAVVLVNNGNAEIIVERETYEDLIKREVIPDYLMNKA